MSQPTALPGDLIQAATMNLCALLQNGRDAADYTREQFIAVFEW